MKRFIIVIAAILLCPTLRAQDSLYARANEWCEQLQAYYKADNVAFPQPKQILFVGSSSIAMWRDLPSYFPTHKVLARGFGGARMGDVLYHMQRLVIDYKPSQIVLYAGENDLSNGVSVQALVDDIKCFVRVLELQLPGVPVIILSIKPSPFSQKIVAKQQQANSLLYDLCQTKNHLKFIDISGLLKDQNGACKEELYLKDRLHISKNAYKLWAQIIEPHLIKN